MLDIMKILKKVEKLKMAKDAVKEEIEIVKDDISKKFSEKNEELRQEATKISEMGKNLQKKAEKLVKEPLNEKILEDITAMKKEIEALKKDDKEAKLRLEVEDLQTKVFDLSKALEKL